MLLADHGTKVRDRLVHYIEHKLVNKTSEITENTNKGYNRTL